MRETVIDPNEKVESYWYRVTVWVCPICGRVDRSRGRVYTEKPEDYDDRFQVIEGWCGDC